MRDIKTIGGQTIGGVAIREARPGERHALLALVARIDAESDFLLREPGERPFWGRDLAAFQALGNSTIFVAETVGSRPAELVGYLSAHGGRFRRNRGAVTLAVGVRRDWNGRGVATALFAAAECWARRTGAHRLELTVAESNGRALSLYDRLGFLDEGLMRDALRVNGAWRSERLMGKLIGAEHVPEWPDLTPDPIVDAPPPARIGRLEIRPALPADAAAYLAYDRAVRSETHFLMRSAAESLPDVAAARRFLAEQRIGDRVATLLAVVDGTIAGSLSLWTGAYARTAHEAGLGLAVRRDFWASGVGGRLIAAADLWVRARRLHRLSLWVFGHNGRARRFYARHGFREEAVARRHSLIDGRLTDHVAMAKLYGAAP
ncbi:GNAT family N-acetyltransferase [Azospirillum brasilense]|uniref:GNAT family N-acetyltransferase n=1 Tax=Azospirillum brasilense TaxID=192 RepID=UPI00190B3334|nr:GNAT family N-acetyltransferase [Azospirillum brasilense]MBK3733335.1 GNAT family N-acetyltransferase [Azospirillum brasilense]